jgi:hypothetical protein
MERWSAKGVRYMDRLARRVAESVALAPGEHVQHALRAFVWGVTRPRGGGPSPLWAAAGGGIGIGVIAALHPGSPAVSALGGGLGASVGMLIGTMLHPEGKNGDRAEGSSSETPVILALTDGRLLVVEAGPAGRQGRCLVEQPLDAIGSVTTTPIKRLGVVIGTTLTVHAESGEPGHTFMIRATGKAVDQLMSDLRSRARTRSS